MAVKRTGDWALARRMLEAAPARLRSAVSSALRQEAHALRNQVVRGLTNQAPGGEAIEPVSPLTLAARRLAGFDGTKALLVRGDLRNAIAVIVDGDEVFVGVPRKARSRDGESLADVAQLQEFGGPPVIIPITPKMSRYLSVLFKEAGVESKPGSGAGVIVVQVPERPFLRPAFEVFRVGAGERFLRRVARELGFGGVS
jgi:hypothetical protein